VVELEHIDARLADQSRGSENGTDGTVLPRIVLGRRCAALIVVVMMVVSFVLLARWYCLRGKRLEQCACRPAETKPERSPVGKRRRHETSRNDEPTRERQIGDAEQRVAWAQSHTARLHG
jgi:hypothetical protein